ncbi:Rv1733c family protein [Streptomyces sp. JNUCC 63]
MSGGLPRAQPPPENLPSEEPAPEELPRVTLWRLRRNPLRRPTDLLQAWIGLGLLLAVLAAVPAAVFLVGDTASRHYVRTAERQEQTRWQTAAVLVHDAPRHPEPGSVEAKKARYPVQVRFTDPGGLTRTARAGVHPGLSAGSSVDIWTDTDGRITEPPMTEDQIRSRSMGWAIIAALTVCGAGAATYGLATLVLRRRNLSAWAMAWSHTAPRWTASR